MDNLRIKIYTRSINLALYNRSMFFLDLPYEKVRLTNTTADGYLYQLIQDTDADIIINIDEDAFVFDTNVLKNLIQYVIDNNYVNCGMPDGGVVHLRRMNPLVTNPYFNILNVSEIRKHFNTFNPQDYSIHKEEYINNFPFNMLKGEYKFVYYEPYYPFFIWLSQNFKTLYLNAENHPDGESTVLCDHNNHPFLIHTWYSRLYNVDKEHTRRINNAVHECEQSCKRTYKPMNNELINSIITYNLSQIKNYLKRIKKKMFYSKTNTF